VIAKEGLAPLLEVDGMSDQVRFARHRSFDDVASEIYDLLGA
jgi:hypothetical protein